MQLNFLAHNVVTLPSGDVSVVGLWGILTSALSANLRALENNVIDKMHQKMYLVLIFKEHLKIKNK